MLIIATVTVKFREGQLWIICTGVSIIFFLSIPPFLIYVHIHRQALYCDMTSVHAIEPGRLVRGAVDRKPLKCFPICQADSADPDS